MSSSLTSKIIPKTFLETSRLPRVFLVCWGTPAGWPLLQGQRTNPEAPCLDQPHSHFLVHFLFSDLTEPSSTLPDLSFSLYASQSPRIQDELSFPGSYPTAVATADLASSEPSPAWPHSSVTVRTHVQYISPLCTPLPCPASFLPSLGRWDASLGSFL